MHHARAITAAVACVSILGLSVARAADPAPQPNASAAQPATQGENVLKTKTRSNQSNDRAAAPVPAKDATDAAGPAEVLKTKTKSNQSNDRAAAPPPAKDPADGTEPAEVLKTKTKSNQSND